MIDTIAGANVSAIIYSIAETAKTNNLNPYNYFEYLLTEIPKHMDDHDMSFCEECFHGQINCQQNAENKLKSMPLFGAARQVGVPTMRRLRGYSNVNAPS